jgi:hypothetical protein
MTQAQALTASDRNTMLANRGSRETMSENAVPTLSEKVFMQKKSCDLIVEAKAVGRHRE